MPIVVRVVKDQEYATWTRGGEEEGLGGQPGGEFVRLGGRGGAVKTRA